MDESLNQEVAAQVETGVLVIEPRRALAVAWAWAQKRAATLACAALLAAMSLQMIAVISRKNITVDEIVMIPSAYYHLATGNFQLVNEHPPFSKLVAAIPLLFVQPNEIHAEDKVLPIAPEAKWTYEESFWERNEEQFDALSFWPRVGMIALTVGLGILLFVFAREFNRRTAVLAVALFSLEPTMLAHGRVVQTDVPAAFGHLLLFFTIYRYVTVASTKRAVWLGIAAACAILAKFSMLLAGPIVLLLFLLALWFGPKQGVTRKKIIVHAGVVALTVLVCINAAYFFKHRALNSDDYNWLHSAFPQHVEAVTRLANLSSHIVPAEFVLGILFQLGHNSTGHGAGLLGMYSQTGWWYYYPVAFALKTTIPFLLLTLIALGWATYRVVMRRELKLFLLLAGFAIYTVFVLFSNIDIGVRYFLPAYTFLFILGGALLDRLANLRRARVVGMAIVTGLIVWMGVEAFRAYPNHMTYLNEFASTKPHWWYLSDSNVEWGDDAQPLAAYLRAHGETAVRSAFLGGFLTLHHYGIGYVDVLGPDSIEIQRTKYIAIGASYLNGSTVPPRVRHDGTVTSENERINYFDVYRSRKPEAVFGGIYLFREEGQ
ncbi:MAG: phospholipid carrier-dependent glycosyltransferase [Pyrinomonadaceae bacterium]